MVAQSMCCGSTIELYFVENWTKYSTNVLPQHIFFNRAETATVNLVGRDGRWQQFDTPCSLISAPQWLHGPCSGPLWFYMIGKRPSVKADLAIYSPVSGVSVQC